MPKCKSYGKVLESPAATPERLRVDKKRAGKRDTGRRPSVQDRLASDDESMSPVEEQKARKEVQREVDALNDVHKKGAKRDNRYTPMKEELSVDDEDVMETPAKERKEKKSVRRDLFSLLGKRKKAPSRDDRYTPSKEEEEQDAEDDKNATKLRLRRGSRRPSGTPRHSASAAKKKAVAKSILSRNKEMKTSLLDHSANDSFEGESADMNDSIDDPTLPRPQRGTATPTGK